MVRTFYIIKNRKFRLNIPILKHRYLPKHHLSNMLRLILPNLQNGHQHAKAPQQPNHLENVRRMSNQYPSINPLPMFFHRKQQN